MTNQVKKIFLVATAMSVMSVSAFAKGYIVSPDTLPQQASALIKDVYPDAQIWKVERKFKKRQGEIFDVDLSNGASLKFLANGECIDINGRYNTVPFSALPQAVVNAVQKAYPDAAVVKVKRQYYGYGYNANAANVNYKVRLNNMMELFITADGQLIGQKFK